MAVTTSASTIMVLMHYLKYVLTHHYHIWTRYCANHEAQDISESSTSAARIIRYRLPKHLTAFTVPGMRLFDFNRLPYGVAGGQTTFQKLSEKLIGPEMEPYAFSYLDDTVVVTETFEEHLYWLDRVLTRIKEARLTINLEKSRFCCNEVRFLGLLVNLDRFKPDPEKIQPIVE